eukprot:763310-Hanusia_phi.AAC.2
MLSPPSSNPPFPLLPSSPLPPPLLPCPSSSSSSSILSPLLFLHFFLGTVDAYPAPPVLLFWYTAVAGLVSCLQALQSLSCISSLTCSIAAAPSTRLGEIGTEMLVWELAAERQSEKWQGEYERGRRRRSRTRQEGGREEEKKDYSIVAR